MPTDNRKIRTGGFLHGGAPAPSTLNEELRQFNFRKTIRHQEPAMVRHHKNFFPSGSNQTTHSCGKIFDFMLDNLRELPAHVMAPLIEGASFRPAFSSWITG